VESANGRSIDIPGSTPANQAHRRAAYLDQVCAGDGELRRNIEMLLRAQANAGDFLSLPVTAAIATIDGTSTERLGSVVGSYKLLEQIGEGGFGVVFMAEQQEPLRRKVALKVIKPGMDSRQVIARFEAERQALALMDHPNIAMVFDAGTLGGRRQAAASGESLPSSPPTACCLPSRAERPYFVMELVKGVPITEFCDQNQLTTRQRLELFVPVCQAVQHAHQKGIIHRDIKPSNVLVTLHDGTPVPKVIDFGIAKAIGQQLTDQTLFTGFAQIIGSPLYMAPEQTALSSVDVDTRSDIYSLGVLLYELLTGTTPFDKERLQGADYDELRRIIREEEPPRPSSRMTTLGQAATTASIHRRSDPKRLCQLLRGELDWIVMKCLEKDRTRRFPTANGLGRDIQRYLRDEPVEACPPGAGYRLRKFAKRNKGRVLAVVLVLLALLAGMAGTTWGMIRAKEWAEGERRAKEEVQIRAAQVENATEILASVFGDLDPQAADKAGVALRTLLTRRLGEAAQELDGDALGDPLVVARLQHVLGISLRELGHLEQAEGVLVKACQTRERLRGPDHLDTAASKHDLAVLYRAQGKYAQAERLYQEVLAVRTAQLGAEHPATLTTRHRLAILYHSQGKYAQAEKLYQEVLAIRTARLGTEHADTLASQHWLALLYKSQGKYAQAEALYEQVLAVRTVKLGADHLDTVGTKGDLAAVYRDQRKYDQAEMLWKEELAVRTAKLGADHPDTLDSQYQLAILYHYQGNYALAEKLHKEALGIRTARLGADHPATLRSQHHLAELYRDQQKYAQAEALYRQVLAVRTAKLGAEHPHTLHSKINLAGLYRSQRKLDRSIPLLEETVRMAKLHPDLHDTLTLAAQADLGGNYFDAGRFADAIALFKEVREKGSDCPELAWVGGDLLTAYVRAGKPAEATALATEQVQAARQHFAADSPQLAAILAMAGQALLEAKAYAAAEPLLRDCLSIRQSKETEAWPMFHTQSLVGAALLGQLKFAEAEPLLQQGYQGMKQRHQEIPANAKDGLTKAHERLVQLYDAWGKAEKAAEWREKLRAKASSQEK
jgi:serine/threonine protein kinase/tetratricopeptide (TPR) repeat protein